MKKILKLVACFLIIVCGLSAVACSIQKDTNISSIEIIEESVPDTIITGKFDEAGIKAKINYEDGSTETITLTTEMLPVKYRALVNIPGNYEITIVLKGKETKLNITIINPDQYLVNFYNAEGLLINTQFVEAGRDAILPDEELAKVEGFEFIGWDRLTTNITEDTNIYGIYASIDATYADIEKIFNSLSVAQENLKTTSHYTNFIAYAYGEETIIERGYVLYNFDKEQKIATSYGETAGDNYQEKFSYDKNSRTLSVKYGKEEPYLTTKSYEKLAEENAPVLDLYGGFDEFISQSKLYAGYTFNSIDYMLKNYKLTINFKEAENRGVYTALFTNSTEYEKDIYIITFDNERIYSFKQESYEPYTNNLIFEIEFYHDYKMPETEIKNPFNTPGDVNFDGQINIRDSAEILLYLENLKEFSEPAKNNADVNQDGFVNRFDSTLILQIITGEITLDEAKNFISGDVNRDGKISFEDLIIINSHIASNFLTGTKLLLADVNGDTLIDINDLNLISKFLDEQNRI